MKKIIKKLKSLNRYDIEPHYDSVKEEQFKNGEYVKWSDIEKILED